MKWKQFFDLHLYLVSSFLSFTLLNAQNLYYLHHNWYHFQKQFIRYFTVHPWTQQSLIQLLYVLQYLLISMKAKYSVENDRVSIYGSQAIIYVMPLTIFHTFSMKFIASWMSSVQKCSQHRAFTSCCMHHSQTLETITLRNVSFLSPAKENKDMNRNSSKTSK